MGKQPQASTPLLLGLPEGGLRKFLVNTVPIFDDASTVRGALASFHDVTYLDRANSSLPDANSAVDLSRFQILAKNQEVETTNTSLQVERNQRKEAQAERQEQHQ